MMSDPDQERVERYEALRAELADLDDAALKERFWQLCEQVMTPVVDLARTHTTPSIERSVLLRMGIDYSSQLHPCDMGRPSCCAWGSTP